MKYLLLIIFAYALNGCALLILAFRVGRPWHALIAAIVWGVSWIPLLIAGWIAGEELTTPNSTLQTFVKDHWPYLALLLLFIVIGFLIKRHIQKHKTNKQGESEPHQRKL